MKRVRSPCRSMRFEGTNRAPNLAPLAAMMTAATLAFGVPPTTLACSCQVIAYWGFVGPQSGRLPANTAGVLWYLPDQQQSSDEIDRLTGNLTVEIARGGRFVEIPVRVTHYDGPSERVGRFRYGDFFLVAPAHGFDSGVTYRFTDRNDDRLAMDFPPGRHHQMVYVVDHEELAPDTELQITVAPPTVEGLRLENNGGLCSRVRQVANIQTAATLPASADSWRDQLLYRTLVDDRIWRGSSSWCQVVLPGRSWTSQTGTDRVYSSCKEWQPPDGNRYRQWSQGSLRPSLHIVQMQAFLPGTGITLETDKVTIDLSCPSVDD